MGTGCSDVRFELYPKWHKKILEGFKEGEWDDLICVPVWRMDLNIDFYILGWDFQTQASGALLRSHWEKKKEKFEDYFSRVISFLLNSKGL